MSERKLVVSNLAEGLELLSVISPKAFNAITDSVMLGLKGLGVDVKNKSDNIIKLSETDDKPPLEAAAELMEKLRFLVIEKIGKNHPSYAKELVERALSNIVIDELYNLNLEDLSFNPVKHIPDDLVPN